MLANKFIQLKCHLICINGIMFDVVIHEGLMLVMSVYYFAVTRLYSNRV